MHRILWQISWSFPNNFQFPLLGFLLCILRRFSRPSSKLEPFQFPLLGFLLCIRSEFSSEHKPSSFAFNSLYWDFCFASLTLEDVKRVLTEHAFQFPLLGFLLCITWLFEFNLLFWRTLSIPFIGIFALHQTLCAAFNRQPLQPFNSLYWDFCFASHLNSRCKSL